MTRRDLSFDSSGDDCAALAVPGRGRRGTSADRRHGHGLSGTRRDRLGAFAERFAAGGFAVLVFDHRGFGGSGGEPDLFDPRMQLEDWRAAIAFARSLLEVQAHRSAPRVTARMLAAAARGRYLPA